MTVTVQQPYNTYLANGVSTVFPYDFMIVSSADITVMVDSVEKVLNVDYTLTGVGDESGGDVIFSSPLRPANGQLVFLRRDMALTRDTDYQQNGDFPAPVVNSDFDRIWLAMQSIQSENTLYLRFPYEATRPNNEAPPVAERANKLLAFDANGGVIAVAASTGTATQVQTDLANQIDALKGAFMVGYGGTTVADLLKTGARRMVTNLTALRALDKTRFTLASTSGYATAGDGGGADFYLDVADATSTDNGGSVIVATDGGRWKLAHPARATPMNFGAKGDGATNDLAAFTAYVAAYPSGDINLGGRTYLVNTVPNGWRYRNGIIVVPASSTDDQPANTAMGVGALGANTYVPRQFSSSTLNWAAGNFNVAIGDYALAANTIGRRNTVVGSNAMPVATSAAYNTIMGAWAFNSATSAQENVAIGTQCMQYTTSGFNNVAVGVSALNAATIHGRNVAVGHSAANRCTTGSDNISIGSRANYSNLTGGKSIAIGSDSLYTATSSNNVAVGDNALAALTTTGINVAVGRAALTALINGTGNTAVGDQAGASDTSGDYNTYLGRSAGIGMTGRTNTTCLGALSVVTGNSQVQLGDSSTTAYAYGAVQNRSDMRDKTAVRDTVLGLDFINALRPVDYRWDRRDDYRVVTTVLARRVRNEQDAEQLVDLTADEIAKVQAGQWDEADGTIVERTAVSYTERDGSKACSRYHHGLIAQEVQALIEQTGVDFGGFQDHKVKGGDDVLSIGYSELIAPLIKAVQQLSAQVTELRAQINGDAQA